MRITERIINNGKSRYGGWSARQLRVLGVSRFVRGWKRRVIGKRISKSRIDRFLALKDAHLEKFSGQQFFFDIYSGISYSGG